MKLALLGAGGHFRVVSDILRRCGHDLVFVLDDDETLHGKSIMGVKVVDEIGSLEARAGSVDGVFPTLGSGSVRSMLLDRIERLGLEKPNAIHPFSAIADSVVLGSGIAVMAGAVINPGTTVQDGAVINTSASVDHDCSIGRCAQIAPGAHLGGGVKIEDEAFVGMGAVVLPCLRVGRGATVGAGAVVTEDVEPGRTVVGIPARALRE